jgi:ABC-type transport system involved in multi-copper enzyme maturation permease subunit
VLSGHPAPRQRPLDGGMLRTLRSEISARDRTAVFRFVIIAYVLFSFLDWMTTAAALALGGREGNPIARSLYAESGSAGLLLFKALVVALIVLVLIRIPRRIMSQRVAVWVATTFVVVTALAVIGNVRALGSLPGGGPHHDSAAVARLM